jgi:N utilization substance protein B
VATVHTARGSVVSLLYALEFGDNNIEELKEDIWEHRKVRNRQKEFAEELYSGVVENTEFLDSLINKNLNERTLEEIGRIEKAVLRIGVYEIKFKKTNKAIVINEALELVRDFGIEPATKLINGVLDSID